MLYRLPPTLAAEIGILEKKFTEHQRGKLSGPELKAHRVPFGIYEQRTRGRYMARIRCAAGTITPAQLLSLGTLANTYGSGRLHVTTRQEVQIHDLPLESIIPVLKALLEAGLATRGGGGNTVRNITASWDSGISPEEAFDVIPHAVELTSRMAALPGSWVLPRKFKIAFSNSLKDTAYATVNDVGFLAQVRDNQRGFKVFVAGGLGRSPRPGNLLHEFIDESEVFEVAEAIKRLFSRHGNRRNKHTARLRFLWNTLGRDAFVQAYERERQQLRGEHPLPFRVEPSAESLQPVTSVASDDTAPPEFYRWKQRYCGRQRQSGYWWAKCPLHLGDVRAEAAMELARWAEPFGDDVIRFTQDQNILFRNIPEASLESIYQICRSNSSLCDMAPILTSAVACAGASTCQLGICLSRGALAESMRLLGESSIDLDSLADVRLHFSGCSNSCGQHGLAHIGFFGKAGRKDNRAYPAYTVVAGANIDGNSGSTLAQKVADIPARAVPRFLTEFLSHCAERKSRYSSFLSYLEKEGLDAARAISEKNQHVPAFAEDQSWYRDWNSQSLFSLEGRGKGECAAGLFDLIEVDLEKAAAARRELSRVSDDRGTDTLLHEILLTSARALLITQTGDRAADANVPELFDRFLVQPGFVSPDSLRVVHLLRTHHRDQLLPHKAAILSFADTIETLYASLDEKLQFQQSSERTEKDQAKSVADLEKDFRGVACPMNFVKTKMALSQLEAGQVLRVLLDDGAPIENVPASAQSEGHGIVARENRGNYWALDIRKAK